MTAEVAIANKLALALAADSIVTITSPRGEKTYNAANKLFTLSKFHPVGILIYGGTAINGVPLETIIKEFRHQLGRKEHNHLSDYAKQFLKFLHSDAPITRDDQQANYISIVNAYCATLHRDIRDYCIEKGISYAVPADRQKFLNAVKICTREFARQVKTSGRSRSMGRLTASGLSKRYRGLVSQRAGQFFKRFKLPTLEKREIVLAITNALLSNLLSDNRAGFVICGYGRNDYYPVIDHFETDGFFADKLKLVAFDEDGISSSNRAIIYPFAQRDASVLFMEGVDPLYQDYIDDTLGDLLSGLAEVTAKHFGVNNGQKIAKAKSALIKLASDFSDDLRKKRFELFVSRALDAVEFLDKNELAVLAESLVSLTALRQKVSLDIETVGGPIDVAVISKGDGFIWVKRKHYFSAEFNPNFTEKYLDTAPNKSK